PLRSRPGGGTLIERWRAIVGDDPLGIHALHSDGHGGTRLPPPGALTYAPSRALAAQVRAEHPYCLHPGCNVPSERCDLDHIVEFDRQNPERGGWTIPTNIGPRCRLHHNLKTRKLWRTELLPEGVLHIVDPLGNHYFTAPTL
ncbi:MAG: HNH endonuclease signature motif containing protein, partial [Rhodococcus sp. (in: high G+C Gram-positive bacteria)]